MIELKPLSGEERAWFLERSCEPSMPNGDVVRKLLAAEAYWREAVKNASVFSGRFGCPFCGSPSLHPPDCPVLLA